MGRFFVNEAKCDAGEGGIACGPVSGAVNVSVNITDGDDTYWITNSEFEGVPNFYITENDVFDKFVNVFETDDDDFVEFMNKGFAREFEGITLGEYEEIFESFEQNVGNPAVALIRYLILLTRCEEDSLDDIIDLAKGKYVDDVEVPLSDIEEEYEEELQDE